jgi:hypothetical protein
VSGMLRLFESGVGEVMMYFITSQTPWIFPIRSVVRKVWEVEDG